MKRKLLLAASACFLGLTSFGQSQITNGSFETWEGKSCGTTTYEEPTHLLSMIGACVSITTNGTTVYSTNIHTLKVAGAAQGSSALKLFNTQGSSSVNTAMYFGVDENTKADTLISTPSSVTFTYKCDIKGTDTASIMMYLYKGSADMMNFFQNSATQATHIVDFNMTADSNSTAYKTVTVNFIKTTLTDAPNHVLFMVNTKSNEKKGYEANVNTSLCIDEITLN